MEIGTHSSPSPPRDESHLSPPESQSKKPGGWRAIKYILANESFEKLAAMSLISNITVYLRTKYNLEGILLVNVVQIWSGTSNISSIAGAIISDAWLGRFLTLLIGTIFSLLGMAAMTLTAGLPELRPPACQQEASCIQPHKWQLAFLFISLGLIAMGAGGIRPCNIAFGADQFDTNTKKGRAHLESFFNWWYFSFTIALVIALTGVVYVQTNISWLTGFAIPTACLAISIAIFLIGHHTYICKKPQGTVFVDMAKVITAAFRKREIKSGYEHSFYDPAEDLESEVRKLIKIKRFKCLDKAAVIVDPSELNEEGVPVNSWKLCSVQQVENLKCLVAIMPVWVTGVGCFVVMDQQSTFGVLQALQMDRSIGKHFMIPPGWMGISSMIALSIWIFLYEQIYIRMAKKLLKSDSRLTMHQRIIIGIIMSILCMIVAGIVEQKRRAMAIREKSFTSPLHVLVLLPQFALSGLTEAFAAVALMEFFTIQLPESMRSIAGAVFFLSLSIASYLSTLIVNTMHSITGEGGKTPWLGGHDLNNNKLDNFYFIVAAIGFVNLIYFMLVARKYVPFTKDVKLGGLRQMETSEESSS
ncbi:protein NRT1/ PTR FAMILY 2.8 isoform X1 [Sesamum indicum]|uniref:Protein NRT1/ PTR FAMILY 2.8 isoform X1 n=1 Tax=Sesamum indicum TaxID=4182 RepID=A0A6I9U0B2_SESIN|nr:protein NRT1/ PTR FAMILY 2.8 isoform X1 [Sesamum indicum]